MFFGVSDFGIDGHLTFDALFQFDPFYFRFALSTSFSVKVFGVGVYSVGYSGLLEGPTPWHIEGKGHISLLFFSISVPFQHTWGSNQDTRLDPIEVMQLADAEFKALSNWEAKIPVASNLNVSLRKLDETETDRLVLHPLGKLRISERKVPINFKLDKVGNKKPKDVNRLKVSATLSGSTGLSIDTVKDRFAIGQFRDLDESARLSSPAFEPLESGNVLISDLNSRVIEVTRENKIVWEHAMQNPVDAFRLPNGNTLITDAARFIVITPDKKIVWEMTGCNYGTARR